MAIVLTMLGFSLLLAVSVKRVGLEAYTALFAFAVVSSVAFLFLYFRLFM